MARRRQAPPAALIRDLIAESNGTCAVCGRHYDSAVLEIDHILPVSGGGMDTKDNLLVVCANCHSRLSKAPREIEFEQFLSEALKGHPCYGEVRTDYVLGRDERFRADIVAERQQNSRKETLVIECRTAQGLALRPIETVIYQLATYRSLLGEVRLVLAVPASIPADDVSKLTRAGIEIWDLPYLVKNFLAQARTAPTGYFRSLLLAQATLHAQHPRELQLIKDMRACRAGKEDWGLYQSLVGEILECLFTPPLNKPICELSDMARANRRDFILPNYVETGFWRFMRDAYKADYVVIDAKNSAKQLKKADVLQVANYLKVHGAGLFGMIICRQGAHEAACWHTLREVWREHNKLILILNDDDIESMLIAKSESRAPEDTLGLKLQQLRLSM